jgi:hypothetical protein
MESEYAQTMPLFRNRQKSRIKKREGEEWKEMSSRRKA